MKLATKYSREKNLDTQNKQEENICTDEESTRKSFGPTKYSRKKFLDPQNTHEKNFRTHGNT